MTTEINVVFVKFVNVCIFMDSSGLDMEQKTIMHMLARLSPRSIYKKLISTFVDLSDDV